MTLCQSHYQKFETIHVDEDRGSIILSGQLPSFYLKQLVQTIAGTVDGVHKLENRVDVVRSDEAA